MPGDPLPFQDALPRPVPPTNMGRTINHWARTRLTCTVDHSPPLGAGIPRFRLLIAVMLLFALLIVWAWPEGVQFDSNMSALDRRPARMVFTLNGVGIVSPGDLNFPIQRSRFGD
jgi:hypothetical protein